MRATHHNTDIARQFLSSPGIPFIPAQVALPGGAPNMSAADRHLFHAITYADEADFGALVAELIANGARLDVIDHFGNGVLDIAIQRNSVGILKALLARGAPLPIVPPTGFDLVMHGAAQGNPDMVSLLIDRAGMLPDATDASGCTALHYAVLSRSARTVELLLQRGADGNRAALNMPDQKIDAVFGVLNGLSGADITPLNIAVAQHEIPVVYLLLEHGAAIAGRLKNPLWLAVNRRDSAMLSVLLGHCIKTGQASKAINQAVLESSLHGDSRPYLLRQLLESLNPQSRAGFDLNTALLVAVTLGHVDQAALLLAHGARPESAAAADTPIWSAALELENEATLNLLTSSCHAQFGAILQSRPDAAPRLLTDLCRLIDDPIDLAANGIFHSSLRAAQPELSQLAASDAAMSLAQRVTATALVLSKHLPASQRGVPITTSQNRAEDKQSPEKPTTAIALQRDLASAQHAQAKTIAHTLATREILMSRVAADAVDRLRAALLSSLSPDFLRDARQHANDRGPEYFMTRSLSEVHGLPDSIAKLIAQTWSESSIVIENESATSATADAQAISRLMALTLYCKLDEVATQSNGALHFCTEVLTPTLLAARDPVLKMVRQPARFLRAIEHRHGWRPVNLQDLARSILQATGLPSSLCNGLAACWQTAVSEAAEEVGAEAGSNSMSHRFQSVDRRFAIHWHDWLLKNNEKAAGASLPLTDEEFLLAVFWCETVRAIEATETVKLQTRKRTPAQEAAGAPPAKSHRAQ